MSYRQLAEIPVPTSASFLDSQSIQVSYTVRDHAANLNRTTTKTIILSQGDVIAAKMHEVNGVILSAYSPSGDLHAVLREGDDSKRWVQVWRKDMLLISKEVTDLHGKFYNDEQYGSLSFSPSERALLYTAEANSPERTEDDPFVSFRFVPTLGEGLAGRKKPTVIYFSWIPAGGNSPPDVSVASIFVPSAQNTRLGQPIFLSEDQFSVTGYELCPDGRLLGVKGCYNRPAGIWRITIQKLHPEASSDRKLTEMTCAGTKVSPTDLSSHSPRSNSSLLCWLSFEAGGPHASCASLYCMDMHADSHNSRAVVNIVWEARGGDFPGIFPDYNLPLQPFLHLGSSQPFVVTHSYWRSRYVILLISLTDGSVRNLTENEDQLYYSWKVLCTDQKKRLLCVRSSPSIPHQVVLGSFDDNERVDWTVIDQPHLTPELARRLESLSTTILPIPDRPSVETIVLTSKIKNGSPETTPPCITLVHGGPHGAWTTSFSAAVAGRALDGYTVSLPNYTGSTGYGQKHIKDLIGRCGSLDVEDCIASVNHLLSLGISSSGQGCQYIQGGSHGGFLTAHLIARFPDVFTAAVLRNPVISCGEVSTTDIPDWYYEEFGLPFEPTSIITPEIYKKLYEASPISTVEHVKTPVLLMVGESDLRVGPTHSYAYYHALKGRGKTVDMLCFPKESHSLDGVETLRINCEAELAWFKRFP